MNFVNHCYVDTEVEMKEIYTSNHIWKLFDNFLVDMSSVRLRRSNTSLMSHCSLRLTHFLCDVTVSLFRFLLFVFKVCNSTTDRNHADLALEKYVTETVMAIVKGFFSSPFSVNHSNLQVLFFTSEKQREVCTPESIQ